MLKVDAADASLMMGGSTQSIEVEMVEQVEQGEASTAGEEELDTAAVAERVRHYLKFNQIQWTRFGALVLGVSQGRLSTLLGKPKPWHQLAPRVRALYQRMQLWMNTKATYGNNPYMKVKEKKIVVEKKQKMPGSRHHRLWGQGPQGHVGLPPYEASRAQAQCVSCHDYTHIYCLECICS